MKTPRLIFLPETAEGIAAAIGERGPIEYL
jgi:hypothetical protein